MGERGHSQGCGEPLDDGKSKAMDSPLDPYKGPRSPGLQFAGSPASVCHAGICLELFPAPVGPSGRSPPQIEQWTESREGKEQGPHSTHFVPKGGASRCAGTWGFVPSARGARASPRKQSRFAARALAARHWLSGRDLPSCAGRSPAPRLGTESAPLPPFTGGGQAHRIQCFRHLTEYSWKR